jgi:hypothetical protein
VAEVWGVRNHLNLDDLEHTSDQEIDAFLTSSCTGRGPHANLKNVGYLLHNGGLSFTDAWLA